MRFNKRNIEELEPRKHNYFVMDDAQEFFGIRVYPSGKKVFSIWIRQNGKTKVYKIGDYPAITIAKARRQAQELILKYQAGVDVKEQEQIEAGLNKTLRDCIAAYLPIVKRTTKQDIERCCQWPKVDHFSWALTSHKLLKDSNRKVLTW